MTRRAPRSEVRRSARVQRKRTTSETTPTPLPHLVAADQRNVETSFPPYGARTLICASSWPFLFIRRSGFSLSARSAYVAKPTNLNDSSEEGEGPVVRHGLGEGGYGILPRRPLRLLCTHGRSA